jgi:spore germination protein GerM
MVVSRANALTVAALIGLLCVVLFTAPRWTRLLSRPVPGAEDPEDAASPTPAEAEAVVERQINVKLYFQAPDRPGLVQEERSLAYSPDLGRQLRTVVEELVKGPKPGGLVPTLAAETKVRDVLVGPRGIAYVSLSREAAEKQSGGSAAEMMAVYSVVNSLAANFPAVRRVQILVDDHPAQTLAGHVDLLKPLPPDMTLLASSTLEPAPSPAAPSASP